MQSFNTPLLNFIANGATIVMLWVGGLLVIANQLTVGELVAFYAYLLQIVGPVRQGGFLMSMASRAAASSERILEVLDTPISVSESTGRGASWNRSSGDVEFDDVTCEYHPGRSVLEHVSFKADPGQHDRAGGRHRLRQDHRRQPDPALLRREQRPGADRRQRRARRGPAVRCAVRSASSCRRRRCSRAPSAKTSASAKPTRPKTTSTWAARTARAEEFIARLPKGYDTLVGERGVSLSGGQKQRVAIARALLMDPRILILDEFTSAVDATTERLIRAALVELMRGRTTFVIAHRLSTVRAADLILVLQGGRLIDTGTHDELLESSSVYRDIHASQLAEPEEVIQIGDGLRSTSPSLEKELVS